MFVTLATVNNSWFGKKGEKYLSYYLWKIMIERECMLWPSSVEAAYEEVKIMS